MMAAYQPQPGMHPGGMPAHGHPGMAPTPGGHMGQPMMQHQGVTGPGQTHVAQAGPMMGMQPGAGMPGGHHPGAAGGMGIPGQPGQGMGAQSMAGGGANAHAMSHLNPQQAAMMQQQQMQQMQGPNPQFAMQQHQQQIMRQRQLQMMAQAQSMGFPPAQTQGMNIQQLQQLIQSNGANVQGPQQIQLPAHLMQQQQMLRMQQQQQHAQAQQQAQANQQLQQQMAMQQANSQQSHQSQQGSAAQPNPPGQPPQMRPQSRMANPNEQNQGAQPQQGQQPAPGQPQQQNTPQGQAQQQGQPQQGMTQQQLAQLQQMRRAQMLAQNQNARQMQAAQMQAGQGPQAQAAQPGGHLILRIMLLGDQLSSFNATNGKDMAEWNSFVEKHFSPDGRLLHRFADDADPNSKTKTYEVLRPTIARYFWTYFESGASSLRLHTENARETMLPTGRYHLSCSTATLTVSYPSGARLEMHGSLNVLFAPSTNIIECLDLQQTKTEDIVARSEIERVLSTFSPTLSTKSPKMTKNKLPKAQQKLQQQFDGLTIDHFPKAPKGSMGVTSRVQQFLEIGETMNVMSELMAFANEKSLRPEQALETLVAQYEAQGAQQNNPQMNMPPNGTAMGQRTPSMQHMQMPQGGNFSPSVSNLNLPNGMTGSPHLANNPGLQANMMQPNSHTPSPHQSNMAAPMMMPQHSQQGTNSSAASANTSPNTNNKRRRSTVKLEDDGPDGQNAGQRVKPSPRMNKKSKPGG